MSKGGQIAIIVLVVVVFLSGGLMAILFGTRAGKTHYICIEINPKIEMLVDGKEKVKYIRPLNDEGRILLTNEDLVGQKACEVVERILTLSAECGFLDLSSEGKNCVKATVLSGLNQGMETHIVKHINGFFVKNNIYGCVIEGPEDLQNFKKASSHGVSAEKYDLALAVQENDPSVDFKKLLKKSNKQLIKMIEECHKNYVPEYSEEDITNKSKLIDFNRENYETHINSITNEGTRKFKSNLEKYVNKYKHDFEVDWDGKYKQYLQKPTENQM